MGCQPSKNEICVYSGEYHGELSKKLGIGEYQSADLLDEIKSIRVGPQTVVELASSSNQILRIINNSGEVHNYPRLSEYTLGSSTLNSPSDSNGVRTNSSGTWGGSQIKKIVVMEIVEHLDSTNPNHDVQAYREKRLSEGPFGGKSLFDDNITTSGVSDYAKYASISLSISLICSLIIVGIIYFTIFRRDRETIYEPDYNYW